MRSAEKEDDLGTDLAPLNESDLMTFWNDWVKGVEIKGEDHTTESRMGLSESGGQSSYD